jgi:membrane protein DedA with SNARE-associated domain
MQRAIGFLTGHGYIVLFLWVLLEQVGLPIPSFPILLAAGALAASGRMSLTSGLLVAVVAALSADSSWFILGRSRGGRVLKWLCRISLEPDSCVRTTRDVYQRYGAKSLLVAKFIPGLGAVLAPLAGVSRTPFHRFVLVDGVGALVWAGCYEGLGYIFADQLEDVARLAVHLGRFLVVLLAGTLVAHLSRKYFQRQRFLRKLTIARITPAELKQLLDAGEAVQIVDLRHAQDYELEPSTLPGAIHLDPKDVDTLSGKIAVDRDVVLYCT